MSGDGALWQVLSDCPHCQTESAVLEWMDSLHGASAFGLSSEARCRMCGWHQQVAPLVLVDGGCPGCHQPLVAQGGHCIRCGFTPTLVPLVPPADLRHEDAARTAIKSFAREEGEEDLAIFCLGFFGCDIETLVHKLVSHQPISTTASTIAYLFPSGAAGPVQRSVEYTPAIAEEPVAEGLQPAHSVPPADTEQRAAARVLGSVMVADGRLLAVERRMMDRFLQAEGLPPLPRADTRVWRPSEIDPPADKALRERIIEAAVHLMYVDGQRDASEWKVIVAVARRFGIGEAALERLDARYAARYLGVIERVTKWWSSGG